MRIFVLWLIGITIWNYGYPLATPLEDVIVSVILFFVSIYSKNYITEIK